MTFPEPERAEFSNHIRTTTSEENSWSARWLQSVIILKLASINYTSHAMNIWSNAERKIICRNSQLTGSTSFELFFLEPWPNFELFWSNCRWMQNPLAKKSGDMNDKMILRSNEHQCHGRALRIYYSFQVFRAVLLQIGHKFFTTSHCLMQPEWKSCPQWSVPRSSPSTYSSWINEREDN